MPRSSSTMRSSEPSPGGASGRRVTARTRRNASLGPVDALGAHHRLRDLRTAVFSRLAARSFGEFGAGSQLVPPIRVDGAAGIVIGRDVYVGPDSWLLSVEDGALDIGDGTRMSGRCTL